jgi:glutathione S-transferase
MVIKTINQLGIEVELRDINEDTNYRDELVSMRDRATVPVLRITSPDSEDRWMPESRDIVSYLVKTYK